MKDSILDLKVRLVIPMTEDELDRELARVKIQERLQFVCGDTVTVEVTHLKKEVALRP